MRKNQVKSSQSSPLIFEPYKNFTLISNPDCITILQSIRSAYFRNKGEYQCNKGTRNETVSLSNIDTVGKSTATGLSKIQCLEITGSSAMTLPIVYFPTTVSNVGLNGACIDFETDLALCYKKAPVVGFMLGGGLSASLQVTAVCPDSFNFFGSSTFSARECFGDLFFLFTNLLPLYCILENQKITQLVTSATKSSSYFGYSLRIGEAGFGFRFSFVNVLFQGNTFNDYDFQVSYIVNNSIGVAENGLITPYSYIWTLIIPAILIAFLLVSYCTLSCYRCYKQASIIPDYDDVIDEAESMELQMKVINEEDEEGGECNKIDEEMERLPSENLNEAF